MSDEKKERFMPEIFTLYTGEKPRAEELERLYKFTGDLSLDHVYNVTVREGQETRHNLQNRLYQVSIGQIAKQGYEDGDPAVIAGKSKFHLLLPHKPIWAAEFHDEALKSQVELEQFVCDGIAQLDFRDPDDLWRAYDRQIRSSTLNVKPFARYLDRFFDVWSRKGVVFELRPSERARALGGIPDQSDE